MTKATATVKTTPMPKRISVKSGKAKARRLQNTVAEDLRRELSLTEDDVRPALMGETGVDIKLMSGAARQRVGLAIECKNVERLNLWEALAQAETNAQSAEACISPAVVFTRNRAGIYAVIPWEKLLWLLRTAASSAAKLTRDSSKSGTVLSDASSAEDGC